MTKRPSGVYFPTILFDSKAYKSLTLQQTRIFTEFLLKRQFPNKSARKNKKYTGSHTDLITNNGKITFSFKEAEGRGFTRPTFMTAIDKLIEVGLIDIAKQGHGGVPKEGKITGECTMYKLSDRWENYGNENFEVRERKKDSRKGRGWARYHARKNQQPMAKD